MKRSRLTVAFEHTGRNHNGGQWGACIGLLGGRDGGAVLNGVVRVRAAAGNATRAHAVCCPHSKQKQATYPGQKASQPASEEAAAATKEGEEMSISAA